MSTRSRRSDSSSRSGVNQGSPGNSSDDSGVNLMESSFHSDSCEKLSRKRKGESETLQNENSADSDELNPSNMPKHSRRAPHDPDSPPFDWQSTKPSLKDRTAFIFERELFCDVHFIIGQGPQVRKISANKVILSIGSAVFDAMFSQDWSSESGEIEVPDVEPTAFSSLIRYLYTDDVSISADTVMALLYAAKKYAVPSLEDKCRSFLLSNLSPGNAFAILTQARSFDEQDLVKACLKQIDTNARKVFSYDSFSDIDLETLCLVLKRNTLQIREIRLFEAVCRWCKAELARQNLPESLENQRLVLERVLPLIRYPLMTGKEVALLVVPSGLLPDSQLVSLYSYLCVTPKPPNNFICTPRSPDPEIRIGRFDATEEVHLWDYVEGFTNTIGFCSDQDIWFTGYELFGPADDKATYDIAMTLVDTITENALYEDPVSYKFELDGLGEITCFTISDPVKIAAHTNYTLKFDMKGPPTCYGINGKKEVTVKMKYGGQVTISFNNVGDQHDSDDQLHTTVAQGQIPALTFSFLQFDESERIVGNINNT